MTVSLRSDPAGTLPGEAELLENRDMELDGDTGHPIIVCRSFRRGYWTLSR